MEPIQEMEIRLWAYIDGLADNSERNAIEKLLAENIEWKNKYGELLQFNSSIQELELDQPSMRFTKNVMEEIGRLQIAPATRKYINKNIIRGIALFFITMITGFIIYGVNLIDWKAAGDSKTTLGVDLGKVDYSVVFSNNFVNIFMMLNVVLGLMLFDRFLNNKRKEFTN